MNLKIREKTTALNGTIKAPPSKSYSHRAFFMASLAEGVSVIKNPLVEGDVSVTIRLLKKLGIKILEEKEGNYLVKKGKNFAQSIHKVLDCKNSGTTFRILAALSLLFREGLKISGEFLVRGRPIRPLLTALKKFGANHVITEDFIYINRKSQVCKDIMIQGDVSSQFITALLLIAPILPCKEKNFSIIKATPPILSYPYIQITLKMLRTFGINVQENRLSDDSLEYFIPTHQKYRPQSFSVPGDYSSAAFIITATVLMPKKSKVTISNLAPSDIQGDKQIVDILKKMGAQIEHLEEKREVIVESGRHGESLTGISIDCSDIPDLFPILSVLGAFADGKTILYKAESLRNKESNRISVMARELKKIGVKVQEQQDGLVVYHSDNLKGANFDHENDHRVLMALIIAAINLNSTSTFKNVEVVKDSYPEFFKDLKKLGAKFNRK